MKITMNPEIMAPRISNDIVRYGAPGVVTDNLNLKIKFSIER